MIGSIGRLMLEHGERQSDNRASALGYIYIGFGHFFGGDMVSAVEPIKKGILVFPGSVALLFREKRLLGLAYFLEGNMEEAEKNWVEVCKYCEEHGCWYGGSCISRTALSSIFIVKEVS